jgi:SAM-dependent methyltransferase
VENGDDIRAEQSAMWNGPSGSAWIESQQTLDAMFQPFEDLLMDGIPVGASHRVLDVGCGTGATTIAAARRLGAGGRAVGIDISEPMLEVARRRAARANVAAEFLAADAETHGFSPASFDTFISRFGLMFFADPARAFANLRGAASPGAELRAITWRAAAENPFMTTAERAAAPLLPQLPPRRADGPGQFAFADSDKVEKLLAAGGWRDVRSRGIDVVCVLPASALDEYVTKLGPVAQFLRQLDEPARKRITDAVLAAFAPFTHGGEVRYTAACWMVSAIAAR